MYVFRKVSKDKLLHQYNSLNSIASYPSTTTNDTCSRQLVRSSFLANGPTQGMFYIYRILSEFRIFRLIILRNIFAGVCCMSCPFLCRKKKHQLRLKMIVFIYPFFVMFKSRRGASCQIFIHQDGSIMPSCGDSGAFTSLGRNHETGKQKKPST